MKTIRLIIAGLVMTMGFSSCSSLFYDAKVDVLNSIQKGMSRQEVTKILGTPEYRRFDRDIDANDGDYQGADGVVRGPGS